MTSKEYVKNVLYTKSTYFNPENIDVDSVHAILGLVTEAGELADVVKRAYFYGKGPESVDRNHIIEEAGDLFWYLALLCNACNISFEEVWAKNIAKLKARYPNKFSTEQAYNRDTEKEREALSNARS